MLKLNLQIWSKPFLYKQVLIFSANILHYQNLTMFGYLSWPALWNPVSSDILVGLLYGIIALKPPSYGHFFAFLLFPIKLFACFHANGVNILVSCTFINLYTFFEYYSIFHSIALSFNVSYSPPTQFISLLLCFL